MVTEVFAATGLVATVKVAVVALAATVTLAGTRAVPVLLLDSVTIAPPTGAGPFSVRVPVEELPPNMEVGLKLTLLSAGGGNATVTLAVPVTPPLPAVTVKGPPAVVPAVNNPAGLMLPPPLTDQGKVGCGLSAAPY